MEAMRQTWTDSRMDDLKDQVDRLDGKVDSGFARLDDKVDSGFARFDDKIDNGFARLDDKIDGGFVSFARLDRKIDHINETLAARIDSQSERIDDLSRTILTVGGRLFGAAVAVFIAIIGLIATQL